MDETETKENDKNEMAVETVDETTETNSILSEIVGSMPEPTETLETISKPLDPQSNVSISQGFETEQKESDLKDIDGLSFDPAIHVSPPQANSKGYLKRKRGNKGKLIEEKLKKLKATERTSNLNSSVGGINLDPQPEASSEIPLEPEIDPCELEAVKTVHLMETAGVCYFGADAFMTKDIRTGMIQAYSECYKQYGLIKTPPWLGVVGATGAWLVPVLQKPEPKKKLKTIQDKVAGAWYRFKNRNKKSEYAPEKDEKE